MNDVGVALKAMNFLLHLVGANKGHNLPGPLGFRNMTKVKVAWQGAGHLLPHEYQCSNNGVENGLMLSSKGSMCSLKGGGSWESCSDFRG